MFNVFRLGTIVKTRGLKGEVLVLCDFPLPNNFKLGKFIFIEKEGILIPFKVLKYRLVNDYSFSISVAYFNSIDDAKKFISCKVFVEKEMFKQNNILGPDEYSDYVIEDKTLNFKGIVKKIINIKNNPIAEILTEGKIILVPFRREFIINVNDEEKRIEIKFPDSFKP